MKTNYPKQHTMTLNGMKIKLSGAKKIKSLLEQIGLGELWMKAHHADIGIVNIIRQRLKAFSCPPTWRPKLLFACIMLNV